MTHVPNILVVDDYEFYRKGLVLALKSFHGVHIIGEASSGEECLNAINKIPVDIILMDLQMMPGMDGIETAKKAFRQKRDLKIIGLTEVVNGPLVREAIDIGFNGLLLKGANAAELEHTLQNIIKGNKSFSSELMATLFQKRQLDINSRITKKEKEVLLLIEKGMTNQQIADKFNVSLRSVTNYRSSLYKRAGVNNGILLVNWAKDNKFI
jgi:DNA-binding NarL/FixJ family response regulator